MASTRPVLIYGTGDLAALAHRCFEDRGDVTVAGFVLDPEFIDHERFQGLPVFDATELEQSHPPEAFDLFVAVGYRNLNRDRARLYAQARSLGYRLVNCISPRAIVPRDLSLGDNCMIMDGVVIQPFAQLDNNIVLWAGCLLSHHVHIHDHCFVGAHAVLSGRCTIGAYSFIGVNATLRDHLTIAPNTLIGAGALVLVDTKERESLLGAQSHASGIPSDRLQSLL